MLQVRTSDQCAEFNLGEAPDLHVPTLSILSSSKEILFCTTLHVNLLTVGTNGASCINMNSAEISRALQNEVGLKSLILIQQA